MDHLSLIIFTGWLGGCWAQLGSDTSESIVDRRFYMRTLWGPIISAALWPLVQSLLLYMALRRNSARVLKLQFVELMLIVATAFLATSILAFLLNIGMHVIIAFIAALAATEIGRRFFTRLYVHFRETSRKRYRSFIKSS